MPLRRDRVLERTSDLATSSLVRRSVTAPPSRRSRSVSASRLRFDPSRTRVHLFRGWPPRRDQDSIASFPTCFHVSATRPTIARRRSATRCSTVESSPRRALRRDASCWSGCSKLRDAPALGYLRVRPGPRDVRVGSRGIRSTSRTRREVSGPRAAATRTRTTARLGSHQLVPRCGHRAPGSVDQLYAQLMAPPYGMKEGPIPAADRRRSYSSLRRHVRLRRRLVPASARSRAFRATHQDAGAVLAQAGLDGGRPGRVYRDLQDLRSDRPAALPLTSAIQRRLPLFDRSSPFFRPCPNTARKTGSLSPTAQRVRDALARQPQSQTSCCSRTLPAACGLTDCPRKTAPAYICVLGLDGATRRAHRRLRRAARTDRRDAEHRVRHARARSRTARGAAFAVKASDRARHRSPPSRISADGRDEELEDREWLEAIATVLAQKPPASWSDTDLAVFESAALELARPFRRLELLISRWRPSAGRLLRAPRDA